VRTGCIASADDSLMIIMLSGQSGRLRPVAHFWRQASQCFMIGGLWFISRTETVSLAPREVPTQWKSRSSLGHLVDLAARRDVDSN
jgi:hypothetical protein